MLGFKVIDEDVEEVIRAFDTMFQPKARNLVDVFLTVEQSGDFAEVSDDCFHFLAVLCDGHMRWRCERILRNLGWGGQGWRSM